MQAQLWTRILGLVLTSTAVLAACGGGSTAPVPSSVAPASAAAPKPVAAASSLASASAKPAAGLSSAGAAASAKPSTAAASGSAAAKPAVKIAYPSGTAVPVPLYIAKDIGFWDKAGVNVELIGAKSAAVVPSLISNDVQFGCVGSPELVNSDMGGASLVMLATFSNLPAFSLYADKSIKTVADLTGKGIGVTSVGSATDLTAQLFLKKYNLTDKVKIVPTGGDVTGVLAAMVSNQLPAGILSPPSTGDAAKQGYVELVNGPKAGISMIHDGIIVTRQYLGANQETIKNVLKGYAQAWTFAADPANKVAVVKDIGDFLKASPDLAQVSYDYQLPIWQGQKLPTVDPAGVQNTLDQSKLPAAKSAKPQDFIDNSLIQAAG